MTDVELLAMATQFTLIEWDSLISITRVPLIRELKIEIRGRRCDNAEWAIVSVGACLNHDGEWEHEPLPSSRNEEFFQRCRWPTLHEAIAFAQDHMQKYPTGYKPEPK